LIVLLKLKHSGSYVIGIMSVQEESKIELQDACHLWSQLGDDGYPELYFAKYCLYNKGFTVSFLKDDILHYFNDVDREVVNLYNNYIATLKLKVSMPSKRVKKEKKEKPRAELMAFFEKMISNTEIH